MITLPMENQRWPRFRLLTRPSWGGTTASGGGWQERPLQRNTPFATGFILLNYTRCLLPQIGNAEILFRFGEFSGKVNSLNLASAQQARQGEPWDPTTSGLSVPDLIGQEIRIQAVYPDEEGRVGSGDWVTVWWGTCEYQTDDGWGAATIPSGERTYHCLDAFARTRRWFMDRHGFISSAGTIAPAAGHPGYNVSRQSPSQIAGNKDSTGSTWVANPGDTVAGAKFTLPGAGNTWTDADAINEALTNHRPPDQPHWVLGGASDLFNTSSPGPVEEGETVFDLVTRICGRSRGRGAVYPTWIESSPTGELTCRLLAFAQTLNDIVYQDPAASQVSLPGASSRTNGAISGSGDAINVDVIGDHRFLPDSLRLGDPEQYRVDYLVSQGERIEVLGTVEHSVTLEPGWSTGEQEDFLDLDADKRVSERWRPVYQLHRLKRGFELQLADGNGGSQLSADWRCTDAGDITIDTIPNGIGGSAPSMIEVMDDLPLYDGYSYVSAPPFRYDGQTATAFSGTPTRKEPLLLIRTASDQYKRHSKLNFPLQYKIMPDGFLITCSNDQENGTRAIGDTGEAGLSSLYDYDSVVMTLGFRVAHRVRMATGSPTGARRMIITHPNIHLWLSSAGAIWDLDDADAPDDGAYPAKRNAGGSSPGILRDDRSALARLHAMAVAWYRPRLPGVPDAIVRNASWSLRCCGDIPSSTDYDGGSVIYPTCGKVVRYLYANGQQLSLNTVCSSVSYDNTSGTTTWTTDWQNLDFSNG
jgi:hypothetical protein